MNWAIQVFVNGHIMDFGNAAVQGLVPQTSVTNHDTHFRVIPGREQFLTIKVLKNQVLVR